VGGERVVPLRQFYLGPNRTVIQPDELLTEIRIRATGKGEGSCYQKIGRRQAMTLAVLNATSRVKLDDQGVVEFAAIALGAAAPTLLRIQAAEAMLVGKKMDEASILEAGTIASQVINPIDDVHGTIWYRRKVTGVLVARTLREAAGINGGG